MRPVGRVIVLALLAALPPATGLAQTTEGAQAAMPDFSHITSVAAAKAAATRGELVQVLLFPAELGGRDVPENRTYITPAAAQARQLVIGTLKRFIEEGLIDDLDVRPEYKGDSFVPSRIVMVATHRSKGGKFRPTIEVW